MKENNYYYNILRNTPPTALKQISAGRLKGMSDINPMWRIQIMTETFGMCGIGWKYEITKQWLETYGKEIKAFCNINLYVRNPETKEWSDAIPGTGGSSFVAVERNGEYVSDECFKMALTDALSVAMKALGVGADVYFQKGRLLETKYDNTGGQASSKTDEYAEAFAVLKPEIATAATIDQLKAINEKNPQFHSYAPYKQEVNKRFKELQAK